MRVEAGRSIGLDVGGESRDGPVDDVQGGNESRG